MYHSEVSVITALRATLEAAKQNGQTVLVKGHPVNPSAMIELQSLTREYPNAVWMDDVSILDAIENSKCVVTVNSGTGMEALALGKSVLVFGRCEYDCVAMKTNPGKIQNDLKNLIYNHTDVVRFFEFWDRMTFDTTL
jgi:capsule polysaccharide modification protein KpsS